VDVAIIGGGLAGLSCAVALRDSGLAVVLLEAEHVLGGRAQSWMDAVTGDSIDLGPHILLTEYRNMLALLDLLGTRNRIVWQSDPLIRLRDGNGVTDMHLHPLPPPLHLLPSFGAVRSVDWRDKLSNRRILWLAMHLDEELVRALDGFSAAQVLRHYGVSNAFIDWFWASACMAVLNVPLERCSAGALLRVFAQMIGRKCYRIGFADVGLGEIFVPGACRLIERSGGRIQTRAPVDHIRPRDCNGWEIGLADGTRLHSRFCVAAVPPQALRRLLPHAWLDMAPFRDLDAFEPSPYVSSYLWFDHKLGNEKFWSRIWRSDDLNSDFYDLSNIRHGWRQRASVIASNIIYSHRAHTLSDEEIIAATVEEIRQAFPSAQRSRVRHAVINRVPMAIPCPVPGTEKKRPATTTPLAGLLLAGDWTSTELPASMESAVHSGGAAAEEIWRSIGRPRRLVLPKRPMEGLAGWVNRRSVR
jgi:squalene-associated FAD-dependent desaturase